jgi:hypothetical protein
VIMLEFCAKDLWLGAPNTMHTANLLKTQLYIMDEKDSRRKTRIRNGLTERFHATTWVADARLHFQVRVYR